MATPILATKLYVPLPQPNVVPRPRLVELLDAGLGRKLTLISAAAGFGKTTLVSSWATGSGLPVAWLSLDEGDSDPRRFLLHLIAAIQTAAPAVGEGLLGALQAPQPPSTEAILTSLLNDVAGTADRFMLVLDDYHVVDSRTVDDALAFLFEHLPPQIHLVIATREDPQLPLARARSRGQLTELRAADLRFTPAEAAAFLNQTMNLNLSEGDIAALERRTEGWIAGLQLAALSMQGRSDVSGFIASFTGSHRFVLDYLMEEVLQQQPEHIQTFLLQTSILERMCGPLCDAVLRDASADGQATLEYLDRANLFIVPLDDERSWFRYHHLFGDLLRQRLRQSAGQEEIPALHARASAWYEQQGLDLEAFHHATAANDIERAERLIEGQGAQLFARGGALPVLNWLESLPESVLNERPALRVLFASALSVVGQLSRIEPQLRAAEAALQVIDDGALARSLSERIADLRSLLGVLAADPDQIESTIARSQRALAHPDASPLRLRAFILWKLGLAYFYRGDRRDAAETFSAALAASQATGNRHVEILTTTGLGKLHELDNHLDLAAETFRHVLALVGEPPGPVACEAHLGLARIAYERDDLDAAERHGTLSVDLARQIDLANFVSSEVFLARLQLARGDVSGALSALARTAQTVRQRAFWFWMPEVAATQVRALLRQGDLDAAAELADEHALPLSRARVALARGDAGTALDVLAAHRRGAEARGWHDELLKGKVLQALAHHARGERAAAMQALGEALALAEPGGFVRLFVDEGAPMEALLSEASALGIIPAYTSRLLAAFGATAPMANGAPITQPLIEPLTARELEILRLIAEGRSNHEIGERLYLALSTVKGHNRNIFGKLQVQRRTEAIARARELGLL